MNHENAPATHCACCGRALVDAVSVEHGIGPDCRARFGTDVVVDEAARGEANAIVFRLARRGMTREDARPLFDRLAALGFVVLAERVAKRFRAVAVSPSVEELRAAYRAIRAELCYDNATPGEVDDAARELAASMPGGAIPANFVAAIGRVRCPCRRCAGTGRFVVGTENGQPKFGGGECFRCGGAGEQGLTDARRNRAYDRHAAARAVRAA